MTRNQTHSLNNNEDNFKHIKSELNSINPELATLFSKLSANLNYESSQNKIFWQKLLQYMKNLNEEQEKFKNLAQTTSAAILIYQNEFFIYANPAAIKMCGYTLKELKKMKFWEFIAPEYQDIVKKRGSKRQQNLQATTGYEFKIITKQGREKWVYLEGTTTEYQGKPAGLISVIDITERKIFEQQLQVSEERFRNMANLLPEGIFEMDKNFQLTYANHTCFDLFQYTYQDFEQGISALKMIAPYDHQRATHNLKKVMGDQPTEVHEYTAITKDGKEFPVLLHSTPIRIKKEIIGIRGIVVDISNRVKNQETLRRSEQKLRTFLNSMTDLAFLKDEKLQHLMINESYAEFLGKSLDDIIGKSDFELLPSFLAKQCYQSDKLALNNKKPIATIEENGGITFETRKFPVKLENGKIGLGGIIRDITERTYTRQYWSN